MKEKATMRRLNFLFFMIFLFLAYLFLLIQFDLCVAFQVPTLRVHVQQSLFPPPSRSYRAFLRPSSQILSGRNVHPDFLDGDHHTVFRSPDGERNVKDFFAFSPINLQRKKNNRKATIIRNSTKSNQRETHSQKRKPRLRGKEEEKNSEANQNDTVLKMEEKEEEKQQDKQKNFRKEENKEKEEKQQNEEEEEEREKANDDSTDDGLDPKTLSLSNAMLYREGSTINWEKWNFTHSSYEERLAASKPLITDSNRPPGGLKLLLLGKPCSGKGTQAPLMARKYGCVHISTGDLLREEVRAGSEIGKQSEKIMDEGGLIPDDIIISLVQNRLSKRDCEERGWILDGFPRAPHQVEAMAKLKIFPDRIIVLEILGRLVWRTDDDLSTLETRLKVYEKQTCPAIEMYLQDNNLCGVTDNCDLNIVHFIPTARNELEVFSDISLVLNEALSEMTGMRYGPERAEELQTERKEEKEVKYTIFDKKNTNILKATPFVQDIPTALPSKNKRPTRHSLLHVIDRCNNYDLRSYIPVVLRHDGSTTVIGYASIDFANSLSIMSPTARSTLVRYVAPSLTTNTVGSKISENQKGYLLLAPEAISFNERNRVISMLTEELVKNGIIPKEKIRNELQSIHDMVHPDIHSPPLAKLERAAMIYFGIPSYGVHINGFYRDPLVKDNRSPKKIKMWIGIRSESKPTYPGLYDHMAAGGQPDGISFYENAKKECMEEAGIPLEFLESNLIPTGMISYRYQTNKGLSTKLLNTFDLELPPDFTPVNEDGETSSFHLWDLETILLSIETRLDKWKPNVAITIIDFAIRHGYISPDHENYAEIVHKLRGAYYDKQNIYS